MRYNPVVVFAYFRSQGLPEPEIELRFEKKRKWRWDFAWRKYQWVNEKLVIMQKVALEVQGGIWPMKQKNGRLAPGAHGRGTGIMRDYKKLNAATCLGWRVLYCTPKTLLTLETVEMVKTCLGLK